MAENTRTRRKGHDPSFTKGIDAFNPKIKDSPIKFERNKTTKGIGGSGD